MKISISKRLQLVLISLAISFLIIAAAMLGYTLSSSNGEMNLAKRFFILIGGNFKNGGYIQFLTYLAFFWSLLDILEKKKNIKKENISFKKNLLPTNEKHLLLANDLRELYFKVIDHEKRNNKNIITDLIKKACLKFRSSKSISEVTEIISIQVEINKDKSESEQSDIRYLTWVIPSIGFIGTVLGISNALQIANSGELEEITATLGVAFDTTLISLILSIIVMWFFHNLQEETDKLHAESREFVMTNLVNRIEP